MLGKAIPPVRSVTDAKRLQRICDGSRGGIQRKPAPFQLGDTMASERMLAQHAFEVRRSRIANIVQFPLATPYLCLLPAIGLRTRLLNFDAGARGKFPYRFDEFEPLDALQELDRVPSLVTTKTIVEPALGVDVKARRLLFVKRANADVAATTLLKLHGLTDELHDADLSPDTVEGLLSDHGNSHTPNHEGGKAERGVL